VLTARDAQTDNYLAVSSAPLTVHFALAKQATLLVAAPLVGTAGQSIALKATGGSGVRSLTFRVAGANCSLVGTALSATTATTCQVTVTNPGNGIYASVTSSPVAIVFTLASQTAVTITSPTAMVVGTPLPLAAAGGRGITSYRFTTTSPGCTIRGAALLAAQSGTCTVTAQNPANGIYAAKQSLPVTVTVTKPNTFSLYVLFTSRSSVLSAADQL
jgi:hypothetical protein